MGSRRRGGRGVLRRAVLAALLVPPVVITVQAYRAQGTSAFERWGVWAQVFAFLIAGLIALIVPLPAPRERDEIPAEARLREIEDELTAQIGAEEREQLARLLGTDQLDTVIIDVRFTRDTERRRDAGGAAQGRLSRIGDYYAKLRTGRLAIAGVGGAGKSVLALRLLVSLVEARRSTCGPVPIRYALAGYDPQIPLRDWLVAGLYERFPQLGRGTAERLVRDGRILPFLDGLDEMAPGPDSDRAAAAMRQINHYLQSTGYGAVVTCRLDRYRRLPPLLDTTTVLVEPLKTAEVRSYLVKQVRNVGAEKAWTPLLDWVADLVAALDSPWRLHLAATYLLDGNEAAALLPSGDGESAEAHRGRVTSLLLGRFVPAATRLCPPSPRGADPYDPAAVHHWLRTLAVHVVGQEISLPSLWQVGGRRVVAVFHGLLNGVVVTAALVGLGVLAEMPRLFIGISDTPGGKLVTFNFVVVAACLVGFAVSNGVRRPPARVSLRRSMAAIGALRTTSGRRRALQGFAFALLVFTVQGCVGGALFGGLGLLLHAAPHSDVLPSITWFIAVGTIGSGLLAAALFRIKDGRLDMRLPFFFARPPDAIDTSIVVASGPRDAVRDSLASGLLCALVAGVAVGLLLAREPVQALIAATLTASTTFLLTGPLAVRYLIGAGLAALGGALPLRLGRFLDWAYLAGLLRINGPTYQFRHEELQRWLQSHK